LQLATRPHETRAFASTELAISRAITPLVLKIDDSVSNNEFFGFALIFYLTDDDQNA